MKLDSKYFDSIRVAPKRERGVPSPCARSIPACQWKGCTAPGRHKAPRGRGRDGQYYLFCLDHVRQYNASYNYFDGMNDSEVEEFQKDALTGHRPTWKVGVNAPSNGNEAGQGEARPRTAPARSAGARSIRTASLPGARGRHARRRSRTAAS